MATRYPIATQSRAETFTNKTLTSPIFQGTVDGWISANETPTYASATTINVAAGAASKYMKGDKIGFVQSAAWKYFYVVTVADTLLTLTGGSDYTVADAAITQFQYSHAENPIGFPSYFAYTPTNGNVTLGNGTQYARFSLHGKMCHMAYSLTFGSTTSFTGTVTIGTPITSANVVEYLQLGLCHASDNGTPANNVLHPVWVIKNSKTVYALTPAIGVYSATVPFTWAEADSLRITVNYEIL